MAKAPERRIYITDSIDEKMFNKVCEELDVLESGKGAIELILSSGGGNAYDALAIAGRLRRSHCAINVVGYGLIASAAVIILAYGNHRKLTKETWVMVHEDSGKEAGTIAAMEKSIAHSRRMETQWCQLIAEHTKADFDTWTLLHRDETYLSAKQCMELGLIEEIV